MGDTRTAAVRQADNQLAAARGRDILNAAIHAKGVLAIVQPPYGTVSYGRAVYGSVSINVGAATGDGVTLWIDRDPHPFEGTRRVRITISNALGADGTPSASALTKIDAFLARIADLQLRDEAIRASGEDVTEPSARHYRVHELVARLADHAGVRREELCDLDRYPQGGRNTMDMPRGKQVKTVYRYDADKMATVVINAEARGDRIVVPGGTFYCDQGPTIEIVERATDLTLQLMGLTLPETVTTSMRGRMLGGTVKHPAFTGLALRIVSATPDPRGIILKLPISLVPLSPT